MTEVISVRFRSGCKNYYFDPQGLEVKSGQHVIVETSSGQEYVTCSEGNHEVPDEAVTQPLRAVLRIATENDRRTDMYNREREQEAFRICEKKIAAHGLEMKLIRVESNFDGSKIIFFFTAEGRVDFRELVKDLANAFRARIELRQVGVRDEAKMLGGLGICGRPLCCSQFLDEFVPVSIKMAKTQNLSLNPTKISGTCGRLMCCLKYEQNAYEDAVKRMPKNDSFVQTPDGPGNVSSVDLLREEVKVRLDDAPETPRAYKGCEIRILRNGKGSRDGIEIPAERPARYIPVVEKPEPVADVARFFFDFREQSLGEDGGEGPAPEGEKRSRSSRRRRGGRGGERRSGEAHTDAAKAPRAPAPKPEGKSGERRGGAAKSGDSRSEVVKVERISVKPSGDLTAEKKAAADRKAGSSSRRRRGGRGRGEGEGKAAPAPSVPQQPKAAKVSAQNAEKPAGSAGEGGATHHRRHRPHRRRGGNGGGSGKPTAE